MNEHVVRAYTFDVCTCTHLQCMYTRTNTSACVHVTYCWYLRVGEAVFFALDVAHEELLVGAEVAEERQHVRRVLFGV
jgi:hypothetical protein